jgi:uncharacterized membrane protein
MERMLVVVFDDEPKALEASEELTRLDGAGNISVYAEAVVKKNADSTVSIEQSSSVFPGGNFDGTAIGALVGLLSDYPVEGAAEGAMAGSMYDMDRAGVNAQFLDDVSEKLKPGKWAVVSDISEEAVNPVDSEMKALGGHVFREDWQNVEEEQDAREKAAIQADIKQLDKEEKQESRAEKKAEIHAKADALRDKLHNKLEQAKIKSEDRKKEIDAKINYLRRKLANARGNTKKTIESRVNEIQKRPDTSSSSSPTSAVQQQTQAS